MVYQKGLSNEYASEKMKSIERDPRLAELEQKEEKSEEEKKEFEQLAIKENNKNV